MKVCGIIAEYDPFHLGHQYQMETARQLSGADYVVCVLSTAFLQRGVPALFPTKDRVKMALLGGADAVFSLPVTFSPMEAERFALGGIYILNQLNAISHLSFGCECDDISLLSRAAEMLEEPSPLFQHSLRQELNSGASFAAAQGKALSQAIGFDPAELSMPNNTLAICYLRMIRRLSAHLLPMPVKRLGAHDESSPSAGLYPCASYIRKKTVSGDWDAVQAAVPPSSLTIMRACASKGELCPENALDQALLYRLRQMDETQFERLPNMSEGLENRFIHALSSGSTREELIGLIKTRRYPYARISRALTHALLGIKKEALPALPTYTRLLGFKKTALPLLHQIGKESQIPVYSKNADHKTELAQDASAEAIRSLGTGKPPSFYTESPVII